MTYLRLMTSFLILIRLRKRECKRCIKLVQYRRFYTEDNRAESLSLYDDTSVFDDVLEVPMSRAQPMRLTTKVAQQWYRMFAPLLQNGVGDITNYGPAKGGTCYFPPSNIKTFRYNLGYI